MNLGNITENTSKNNLFNIPEQRKGETPVDLPAATKMTDVKIVNFIKNYGISPPILVKRSYDSETNTEYFKIKSFVDEVEKFERMGGIKDAVPLKADALMDFIRKEGKYVIAHVDEAKPGVILLPEEFKEKHPEAIGKEIRFVEKKKTYDADGVKHVVKEVKVMEAKAMTTEESAHVKTVLERALNEYIGAVIEARKGSGRDVAADKNEEVMKEADERLKEQENLFKGRNTGGIKRREETVHDKAENNANRDVKTVRGRDSEANHVINQSMKTAQSLDAKRQKGHEEKIKEQKDARDKMIESHHERDDKTHDIIEKRNIQQTEGIPASPEKPKKT